LWPVIG